MTKTDYDFDTMPFLDTPEAEIIYMAWVVIANANQGRWDTTDPEWLAAAIRWRDSYHAWLKDNQENGGA